MYELAMRNEKKVNFEHDELVVNLLDVYRQKRRIMKADAIEAAMFWFEYRLSKAEQREAIEQSREWIESGKVPHLPDGAEALEAEADAQLTDEVQKSKKRGSRSAG